MPIMILRRIPEDTSDITQEQNALKETTTKRKELSGNHR